MKTIIITGNTFPVKDQLKSMGGKWNAEQKGWEIPVNKQMEAQKLVNNAPKVAINKSSNFNYSPSRCKLCGCSASRYNKIYRNGICKDCYVSEKEEANMGY